MDAQANLFHEHLVNKDYVLNDSKQLGEGGFGAVCSAIHITTKAERACKKIMKKHVKDRKTFEREFELQKALDHKNICRIYDVYQDAKMYYIILELCKGGELFDRIVQASHFGEDTVGLLAKQMLSGLLYMHSNNMAHRDLKPENYLLAQDLPVDKTHLKLIDFGMSRKFTPGKPMTTRVITPYYVSPDVLSGSYSEACDIWSLGVIFYILFCGSPPFFSKYDGRKGDEDIFRKVKRGEYTFDSSEWKHVSMEARNFVADILNPNPKKRPTAAQLLEHHWLVVHMPKFKPVPLSTTAITSLKEFRKKDRLQKVALQMIAKYVDDTKVDDLQKMFESMDEDKNGTLTLAEMKTGLEKNGLGELVAEMEETMKEIDNDGSGLIDYSEFLAATMGRKVYLQYDYLWQVFKQFDATRSGKISKDDLVQVLSGGKDKKFEAGKTDVMKDVDDIMLKYDTDKSGDIDFDEFMELMRGQTDKPLNVLKQTTDLVKKTAEDPAPADAAPKESGPPNNAGAEIAHPALEELDSAPRSVGCCGFF
jgi:calcium-dependent protein kinase